MTSPVALTGTGNVTTFSDTDITGAETISIPKPANLADNETLCIVVNGRNASLTWDVVPSGVVSMKHVSNSGTMDLFTKKIRDASSEPATYDFSPSAGAGRCVGLAFRVTGTNVGNAPDVAGNNNVDLLQAPGLTPGGIDRLLLGVFVTYGGSAMTITPPTGMTLVGNVGVGSYSQLMVCQQALSSATPTGNKTATVSPSSSALNCFLATLKPEITADLSMSSSARSGGGFAAKSRLAGNLAMSSTAFFDAEGDILQTEPQGELLMSSRASMLMTARLIKKGAMSLSSAADLVSNPAYGEYNILNAAGNWQSVPIRQLIDGSWI